MKKISKSLIAMAMAIATIAGTCPLTTAVQIPQTAVAVTTEENVFENKTFENPFTVEKALEAFNANGSYDEYISNALVYQNETAEIYYVINEETNEATIVGLKAKASDVIVPEFISDEVGVFEILSLWNPETKLPDQNVKSIQMECTKDYRTSIQLIDSYAFSGFENLESIKFPALRVRTRNSSETHSRNDDHYLTVNKYAFDGCYNLEEMVLPNAVEFETTAKDTMWYEDRAYDKDAERYTSSKKGIKLTLVGISGSSSGPAIVKDMIQLTDVILSAGYCQEKFKPKSDKRGSVQRVTLLDIENKINIIDEQIDEAYDYPLLRVFRCNIGEIDLKSYSYNDDNLGWHHDIGEIIGNCTIDKMTLNKYWAFGYNASDEADTSIVKNSTIHELYFNDDAIMWPTERFRLCTIDNVSIKSTTSNHMQFLRWNDEINGLADITDQEYKPWIEELKNMPEEDRIDIHNKHYYPYADSYSNIEEDDKGYFMYCDINHLQFREGTDFIPSFLTSNGSVNNIQFPNKVNDMVISPNAFYRTYSLEPITNIVIRPGEDEIKVINPDYEYYFKNYLSKTKINVKIPDGTLYIGENAFGCINIDTLFIPKSVIYCDQSQQIIASNVIFEGKDTVMHCNKTKFYNEEFGYSPTTIYGCINDMNFTDNDWGYLPANKLCEKHNLKFVELHSGDINLDSEVTIADAVKMQRYLLGIDEISMGDYFAGDLTGDNTVDVFDMVLLRQKLVKSLGL